MPPEPKRPAEADLRRIDELLTVWKAPANGDPVHRLIALRNREIETVAAAMATIERLQRQREELLRHIRYLAVTAPPSVKRETKRLLEGYR